MRKREELAHTAVLKRDGRKELRDFLGQLQGRISEDHGEGL